MMLAPSAATLAAAPAADTGFWDRFLTSAGFAGAMAVVAASIAAVVAWKQFRGTQRQQANQRWWDTLTWVYDRAIVEKDKRKPLPQPVTMRMLRELFNDVPKNGSDPLRGNTISAILEMFEKSDGDRVAADLRENLREDLTTAGYGREAELYRESYLTRRAIIGSLGILLPTIFIIGNAFSSAGYYVYSLSAYYYTWMRDIYVAGFCVTGFLMAAYILDQSGREYWLSLVAGLAAFGVVFFPTMRPGLLADEPRCGVTPMPQGCSPIQQQFGETLVATIHFTFETIFILSLALICFSFAYREKRSKNDRMATILYFCGWAIIGAIAWAIVGPLLDITIWQFSPVYIAEVVSLWAFGLAWLLMSRDLLTILRRPQPKGPTTPLSAPGPMNVSRPSDKI